MQKPRAGVALASVLMVILVVMTMAFSMAASGVFTLHMTQSLYAQQTSRDLASAAIFAAINQLEQNQAFGLAGAVTDTFTVPCPTGPVGSQGWLTFNQAAANAQNVPWSTNLFTSTTAGKGWHSRSIPSHCAHLVGIGQYGTSRVFVEALVAMPPFPYSIAASGTLASGGSLLVGSVSPTTAVSLSTVTLVPPDQLLPGNMASNSTSASSVVLGECYVTGDIRSAGGIQVPPQAEVDGSIQSYQQPVPLPSIDVPSLVASATDQASVQPVAQPVLPAMTLQPGVYQFTGPLLTVQGDLTFNQGVLTVQGDLHVTGGIKGTGAVIVSGNTTIDASSKMATDDTAAILSGGNVTLDGVDMDSSSFQGLVYAGGTFKAAGMTLLGSFVANGGTNSNVTLQNTRLVGTVPLSSTTSTAVSGAITEVSFGAVQTTTTTTTATSGTASTVYLNFTVGSASLLHLFGAKDTPGGKFQGASKTPQGGMSVAIQVQPGPAFQYSGQTYTTQAALLAAIESAVQDAQPREYGFEGPRQFDGAAFTASTTTLVQQIEQVSGISTGPPTTTTTPTVKVFNTNNHLFDVYFNEFISLADQVRILYWGEMDPDQVK